MAATRLSSLRARRLLTTIGIPVGPAAAAGAIAAGHAGEAGAGVLVAISILATLILLETRSYPLVLMPLAGFVIRFVAVAAGVGTAWLVSLTLEPLAGDVVLPALLGGWIVLALVLLSVHLLQRDLVVRAAVVGSPGLTHSLQREVELARIDAFEVVGWVDFTEDSFAVDPLARRLGSIDRLDAIVAGEGIDLLVFGVRESEREARRDFGVSSVEVLDSVAAACLGIDVRVIGAGQLFEEMFGHVPLATINAAWFQYLLHPRFRATSRLAKRLADVGLAAFVGLVSAPLMAIAAAAIKLGDGGPIFYRQRRVGEGGREFEILKLRTMREDAEVNGPEWSSADDDRVTAAGRFLRRSHLDEVPQVVNVLRGEMSMVGPRPERPELVASLERRLPFYDRRELVKPGVTGWAQVRVGYAGTQVGSAWKLAHDLYYLKRRSVTLDLMIMVETLAAPLRDARQAHRRPDDRFVVAGQALNR